MRALLLSVFLGFVPTPPAGFQPVGQRAEVLVYKRAGAAGVELYAEGDIAAPPSRVQAVLLDYANHSRFVKDVAETRILRRSESALWVYQRLDLPMIADRDFTLRVTWGQDGDELWTRFSCDNEQGPPPRSGVVRVSVHDGEWHLAPIAGGAATHARYKVHLDLAGSLPGWMARSGATKEVPALFEGLRREVQQPAR
ncbi:MAG: SRPBCC family protein [Polyangia bacterium]